MKQIMLLNQFMTKLALCLLFIPLKGAAQNTTAFSDFHIHITFKHYYRDIDRSSSILKDTLNLPLLYQKYHSLNGTLFHDDFNALHAGKVSHCANYNQSDHYELRNTPGSVLCTSLYPYEKQFSKSDKKRRISHTFVSKMSMERLNALGEESSTCIKEFLAEYYFMLSQDSILQSERFSKLILAKNNEDLKRINKEGNTAAVLSIEGGHVLYGDSLSSDKYSVGYEVNTQQRAEVIDNINILKNLRHRVFFITLSHFTDNRFSGFCKTIDRPGFSRWGLKFLSKFVNFRKSFFTKFGDGIHGDIDVPDGRRSDYQEKHCDYDDGTADVGLPYTDSSYSSNIGDTVIRELLRPNGIHKKSILIDVKHMDIKARYEYYDLAENLSKEYGVPIPIIAGHVAVSGEKKPVAFATSLYPNFDKYQEVENALDFYRKDSGQYLSWRCFTSNLKDPEKKMYFDDGIIRPEFNPYTGYINRSTANWFYPWGINLCDEEIEKIYKSEGIIGLNFDERILGGTMINYTKRNNKAYRQSFESAKRAANLSFTEKELSFDDYLSCEPLLRNILYVVDHSGFTGLKAWQHVAIGSDFDGLIDPIDICPTAAFIPQFHKKMILALPVFWQLNRSFYSKDLFFSNTINAEAAMQMFFYENGKNFIFNNF